jgi:vancomycin resistance protein YoaR
MIWNPKKRKIIVIILAVILAASMILALLMPVLADDSSGSTYSQKESLSLEDAGDGTILDGIQAGDIDISGLTADAAKSKISAAVAEKAAKSLTVSANGKTQSIALSDLGYAWNNQNVIDALPSLGKCGNILSRYKFRKDIQRTPYKVDLDCTVNEDAIRSFVAGFASQADIAATEPRIVPRDDGTLQVSAGSDGTVVDQDAAVTAIRDFLDNTQADTDTGLELATKSVQPSVSADDLSEVKDILGKGETVYAGSTANRSQNIVNGVAKVNGTLLKPGDQFSLIRQVAPFSEANGYAKAPSYSSGSVVDTYGGGICQVSTTLYLAVLQAELQVDARTNHSMLVSYVTPSMDAAISEEGGKDMIFTNNTDHPIYILGTSTDGKVSFTIYGDETRDKNRTVQYESKVLKQTQPPDSISLDDTVAFGTVEQVSFGHLGVESELWKHVTVNGKTTDELINSDSYETSPITYILGTKGASADALSALQKAAGDAKIGEATDSIAANGGTVNVVQMPEGTASRTEDSD